MSEINQYPKRFDADLGTFVYVLPPAEREVRVLEMRALFCGHDRARFERFVRLIVGFPKVREARLRWLSEHPPQPKGSTTARRLPLAARHARIEAQRRAWLAEKDPESRRHAYMRYYSSLYRLRRHVARDTMFAPEPVMEEEPSAVAAGWVVETCLRGERVACPAE